MVEREKSRGGRRRWAAVVSVAAIAGVGSGAAWWSSSRGDVEPGVAAHAHAPATPSPRAAVARRETRPTLDPAQFTGKAALAYQVAREIPDVLDRMKCYCACDSTFGHLSLLSCYTDGHGST